MSFKVNIENPNPGVFFAWPGSKAEDKGGITLRVLNNKELTRIDKLTNTKKKKFRGSMQYEDITVDEDLRDELIWDYCIVDWTELEDNKGKTILCDLKNKKKLMNENLRFSMFVGECLDKLSEYETAHQEDAIKNS